MMEHDLHGRVALVTGGAVGIGRAIVEDLYRSGASVVFTWYSHKEEAGELLKRLAGESTDRIKAERLDTTYPEQVAECVRRLGDEWGGLDILVNNAGGLVRRASLRDVDDRTWRECVDLNLSGTFYCCRACLPLLRDGGRVINISSQAGYNGGGVGSLAYASAKAGMFGLTRALAKELATRNITVNAVAPGLVLDTPFHAKFTPIKDQERTIAAIPLARAGVPADVAGCVTWLCSDGAAWVTGEIVNVNGGQGFF